MRKYIFLLVFFGALAGGEAFAGTNPFSKITVKSQKAIFQKELADAKDVARLEYSDDVHVTFADKTTVSSDFLEVFVATRPGTEVQRVVFKKNVRMKRLNQKVQADEIEVVVSKKMCELRGNVKVEQVKKKESDVPLKTKCGHATLRWDCEEVELIGSQAQPVSTTIELAGNLRKLQNKKQQKGNT